MCHLAIFIADLGATTGYYLDIKPPSGIRPLILSLVDPAAREMSRRPAIEPSQHPHDPPRTVLHPFDQSPSGRLHNSKQVFARASWV